jgi:hypothetical protein
MVWLTRDPVLFLACELLQALVIGQMGPDAVESAPTTEDMIWWGRGPGLRYSMQIFRSCAATQQGSISCTVSERKMEPEAVGQELPLKSN